jgi:hypothetical protein
VVEGYDPSKEKPPVGAYVKGNTDAYRDIVLQYAAGITSIDETNTLPPGSDMLALNAPVAPEHPASNPLPRLDILGATP